MMNKGSQGGASITPTLYQGQQGGYTPQTGRTNSTSGSNSSLETQITSEEFKTKLPIISPEFTLDYSDRMQKYVATLQGDEETGDTTVSELAYTQWQDNNPS